MNNKSYDPPVGFLEIIKTELAKVRENSPEPIRDTHEVYVMTNDAYTALFYAIKAEKQDKERILKALTNIATTCYRAVEDLRLIENKD
jgi:hypothetical protein